MFTKEDLSFIAKSLEYYINAIDNYIFLDLYTEEERNKAEKILEKVKKLLDKQ